MKFYRDHKITEKSRTFQNSNEISLQRKNMEASFVTMFVGPIGIFLLLNHNFDAQCGETQHNKKVCDVIQVLYTRLQNRVQA